MRKITIFLIAIILFQITVIADTNIPIDLTLQCNKSTYSVGETVSVEFKIADNSCMETMQTKINYNPSILSAPTVKHSNSLTGQKITSNTIPGVFSYSYSGTPELTDAIPILTLEFTCIKAGKCDFTMSEVNMKRFDAFSIPKDIPYNLKNTICTVSGVSIYAQCNGLPCVSLIPSADIKIYGNLYSSTGLSKVPALIMAYYSKDKRLLKVITKEFATLNSTVEIDFKAPNQLNGEYIKIFLLEDKSTLNPLTNYLEIR